MSLCQICLNPKRKPRFDSCRITICQWCVSELLKTRRISPHSYVATLSEDFENTEKRKIARLKNLAEISVAPPIYPEADIKNSTNWALDLIRQEEGLLEAVYRNLIDDKARQHEAQTLSAKRRQDLISKHNVAVELYTQKLNEIAKARDEYSRLEASLANRIEEFIKDKFESLDTGGHIKLPNDRLLRAYQLDLLNWDNEVSSRQDNEAYDQLRNFIKAQDGHACVICHKPSSKSELHVHHIIPLSRYGTNQHVNLVTLCLTCHKKQHAAFDITKDKPQINSHRQQDNIFVALSIKTTGHLETDDIVEISAARFENGANKSRFQSYVYSDRYKPELLESADRIPKQTILAAEKSSAIFEKLLSFIGESNLIFHDANYVLNFFRKDSNAYQSISRRNITDIRKIAEKRKLGLKDNQLSTLLEYLKIYTSFPSSYVDREDSINIGLAFIALSKTAVIQSDKKKTTVSTRESKKNPAKDNKASPAIQPEATMDYAYQLYQQKNYLQAFGIYRKFAKEGNANAQYNLGIMYANAQGVKNNDLHAVYCYQKAADQGDAYAQNNLGWMYGNGRGVEKDDQKAVFWYRKAADQGNSTAQYNMGWMYGNGRGVEKDEHKATLWYRKAADQGKESARNNFIKLYTNQHAEKSNEALIDLYHEALAFGDILEANCCYKMLLERSRSRVNNEIHSLASTDNNHHIDNYLGFKKYKQLIDEYHEALCYGNLEMSKELYIELDKYQHNQSRNILETSNMTNSINTKSFDELLDEYHESVCFGDLENAFEHFQSLMHMV
jgi:DNA polymerase III epsilon subunit-like protein